jgi:hypothetical protein
MCVLLNIRYVHIQKSMNMIRWNLLKVYILEHILKFQKQESWKSFNTTIIIYNTVLRACKYVTNKKLYEINCFCFYKAIRI